MVQPFVDISKKDSDNEESLAGKGTGVVIGLSLLAILILALVSGQVAEWAAKTEKFWSFVNTAVTLLGVVVGLWLVWVKFFRAREFASRLEVTATAGRIPLGASGKILHWVNVKLENKGADAVRGYTIEATPTLHLANGTDVTGANLAWQGQPSSGSTRVLDVACAQQEHLTTQIAEADAAAVTFHVQVTAGNSKWHTFVSVPNSKPAAPDAAPGKKDPSA